MPLVSCPWERAEEGFSALDAQRIDRYSDALLDAAEAYDLPFAFLAGVAWVESRFSPSAVSSAGARGLMQIMPSTWAELRPRVGVPDEPFNPRASAMVGAYYLRALLQRFGNEEETLAGYYAGAGGVSKHGWSKFRSYVEAVQRARDRFARAIAWCSGLPKPQHSTPPEPSPDYGPPRPQPGPRPSPSPSPSPPQPTTDGGGGLALVLALALLGGAFRD